MGYPPNGKIWEFSLFYSESVSLNIHIILYLLPQNTVTVRKQANGE